METIPTYVWIILAIAFVVYVVSTMLTILLYNPPTQHAINDHENDKDNYTIKEDGLYYKSYLSKSEIKIGGINDPRIKDLKL